MTTLNPLEMNNENINKALFTALNSLITINVALDHADREINDQIRQYKINFKDKIFTSKLKHLRAKANDLNKSSKELEKYIMKYMGIEQFPYDIYEDIEQQYLQVFMDVGVSNE